MNIAHLADNLGLTPNEYLELVELLIETSKADLENAEAAMKREDSEEVSQRLHSIKGAAGNLGLMEIYEQAKEGEQMAKMGMLDQIPDTVQRLKSKLEALPDMTNV